MNTTEAFDIEVTSKTTHHIDRTVTVRAANQSIHGHSALLCLVSSSPAAQHNPGGDAQTIFDYFSSVLPYRTFDKLQELFNAQSTPGE